MGQPKAVKRLLNTEVVNLEAKAIQYVITDEKLAGIIALDQAAAFSTISRRYIFWVLKHMKIPKPHRKLLKSLYSGGKSHVCFGGQSFMTFQATSGVKQGCPLSMTLFALATDPIIRLMAAKISPRTQLYVDTATTSA